jgi:hypothetical protein
MFSSKIIFYRKKKRGLMKSIFFPIAIILIGIMFAIRILLTIIINLCYKIQKSLSKLVIPTSI